MQVPHACTPRDTGHCYGVGARDTWGCYAVVPHGDAIHPRKNMNLRSRIVFPRPSNYEVCRAEARDVRFFRSVPSHDYRATPSSRNPKLHPKPKAESSKRPGNQPGNQRAEASVFEVPHIKSG